MTFADKTIFKILSPFKITNPLNSNLWKLCLELGIASWGFPCSAHRVTPERSREYSVHFRCADLTSMNLNAQNLGGYAKSFSDLNSCPCLSNIRFKQPAGLSSRYLGWCLDRWPQRESGWGQFDSTKKYIWNIDRDDTSFLKANNGKLVWDHGFYNHHHELWLQKR